MPETRSGNFHKLRDTTNHQEQEVIFVNILQPHAIPRISTALPPKGKDALWQRPVAGVIDPRPLCMARTTKDFDRIHIHGGIFIVFAAPLISRTYYWGHRTLRGFEYESEETNTNWDFLSDIRHINTDKVSGQEIEFVSDSNEVNRILSNGVSNARYLCTLSPDSTFTDDEWSSVAKNKYGNDVAGILKRGDPKRFVLILPQMPEFHEIAVDLLEEICAVWNPGLFPHLEGNKWIQRREYEIPRIIEFHENIDIVRKNAKIQIDNLNAEIIKTRDINSHWYTLLNGTGRDLVEAVISTIKEIGFEKVVDVDKEYNNKQARGPLKEDMQIHDEETILVIDVKGINGCPDDPESTQAEKHAIMRIREWNKTTVKPLTIINHQRHIPPRDRDQTAFRDEMIENAQMTDSGLMTTWDLFNLMRNQQRLSWSSEVLKPIFYRSGRIEPIPEHYSTLGFIEKVWERAFGMIPENIGLSVGNRIAVLKDYLFYEMEVTSLQIGGKPVTVANPGDECGIEYPEGMTKLRKGLRVFKIDDTR